MNEPAISFSEDMERRVINRLCRKCCDYAEGKGFHGHETVPDYFRLILGIALMHTELSEMVEAVREGKSEPLIVEELADVFIRGFDLAGYWDWDLGEAIIKKMKKNEERPHLHGKRF